MLGPDAVVSKGYLRSLTLAELRELRARVALVTARRAYRERRAAFDARQLELPRMRPGA